MGYIKQTQQEIDSTYFWACVILLAFIVGLVGTTAMFYKPEPPVVVVEEFVPPKEPITAEGAGHTVGEKTTKFFKGVAKGIWDGIKN